MCHLLTLWSKSCGFHLRPKLTWLSSTWCSNDGCQHNCESNILHEHLLKLYTLEQLQHIMVVGMKAVSLSLLDHNIIQKCSLIPNLTLHVTWTLSQCVWIYSHVICTSHASERYCLHHYGQKYIDQMDKCFFKYV